MVDYMREIKRSTLIQHSDILLFDILEELKKLNDNLKPKQNKNSENVVDSKEQYKNLKKRGV